MSRIGLRGTALGVCFGLAVGIAVGQDCRVMVTGATLAENRSVGGGRQPWDGVGGPDPYVVIEFDGKPVFVSGKQQDTLTPRWFTGTAAWPLKESMKVRVRVRDADLAKGLTRLGVAGVSLRSDLPNIGKRFLNDALLGVDTDDLVAEWSGTLGQLIKDTGGVNRTGRIVPEASGTGRFATNAGLRSLTVRVVVRPKVTGGSSGGNKRCLGFSDARVEGRKRGSGLPWDAGLGAAQNPDPRYVVYLNGEPVVAGSVNKDTLAATWPGSLPELSLQDDDLVALAVFDADAGTEVAGQARHAVTFSSALSRKAKAKLYEELVRASTDDLIYLWVGSCKSLLARGSTFDAPNGADPGVWVNRGLARATVRTANNRAVAVGAPLSLTIASATVAKTRADGKAWDLRNGAPDLFLRCFVANPSGGWTLLGETSVAKNTYRAAWGHTITDRRLLPGRQLRLEIYDKDGASDDRVGTLLTKVPDSAGTQTHRDGLVTALNLRFR